MHTVTYQPLAAGDVRQEGDEVRHVDINGPKYLRPKEQWKPGPWQPVRLIGHPILPADLIAADFRRKIV